MDKGDWQWLVTTLIALGSFLLGLKKKPKQEPKKVDITINIYFVNQKNPHQAGQSEDEDKD